MAREYLDAGALARSIVHVAAGDKCVEGLFGNTKAQMRRQNLIGRKTGPRAHINFLSSCWQLRRPGFYGVLEAFQIHREGVQDTISPAEAYADRAWYGGSRNEAYFV